ncbi:MAG TPA: hypothetical protein VGV38_08595, partial [Pyrinomonadaceae bacterium]|nr:hypothetical protein [Pyrinomonadaceae bacterium]
PSPTPETPASTTAAPTPTPEPKAEPEANKTDTSAPPRRRTVLRTSGASGSETGCALTLSEETLSVGPGDSASVSVSLGDGGDLTTVKATTSHWSDIMVLAGKTLGAYTVSSISKKEGTYAVNFASPCGTKTLTVNVK